MTQAHNRYWVWHLFVALGFAALIALVAAEMAYFEPRGAAGATQIIMLPLGLGLVFIGIPAALIGFFRDAERLEAAGAEWVPRPWLWVLLSVVISPFLASAAYVIERQHNVGLAWEDVPAARRLAG